MNNLELAERLDRLQPMQVIDDYGREVVGLSVGTLVTPNGNEPAIRISSRTEVAEMEFIPQSSRLQDECRGGSFGLFAMLAISTAILVLAAVTMSTVKWLCFFGR